MRTMSFWDRLQKIDVRIIYLVMVLSVALPMIWPIGLPIEINKETRAAYQLIEGLESGNIILMDAAYSPGSAPELYPSNLAVARHAFKKGLRIIGFNSWDLGAQLMKRALDQAAEEQGKTYGVDYVVLGYKIPLTIQIRAAVDDVWAAWKADINGTGFDRLPMMDDFRALKEDLWAIVVMNSGDPGVADWITYVGTPSLNPGPNNADGFVRTILITSACTSVEIPGNMARVQAGILTGLIGGGRGAAEYELLIGRPGDGVKGMDSQSMGHLAVIAFIILGNLGYVFTRRR